MTRQFTLPDLGEGVKEGQVLRLLVREGDHVREDQTLMEVETDKAAVEIPSPHAGVIQQLHVTEQQIVNVGDLMVTFGDANGEPSKDGAAAPRSPAARTTAATAAPAPAPHRSRRPASPAVRKLARALDVDLETVEPTGPGGRVTRADVQRAAEGAPVDAAAKARPMPADAPPPPRPAAALAATEIPGVDGTDELGPVRRQPISQTRKTIASVMARSVSVIPHVTDTDDADVTDLDRLRRGYNDGVEPARRLGMLAFVVRAVVRALQRFPVFNASFDEQAGEIVYKKYYHVAVGVQTPRGLVAPVLRDVDRMNVVDVNAALAALIERVRQGSFTLDDTRGATYTISNAGAMGGSRYSTPIITLPQVAVLAVGRSRRMPWVVGEEIVPRLIMPLSHSMDHRLIDGAVEIAFMQQVIADLENPARLMLG